MTEEQEVPLVCVDLGSNSFHLLKASHFKGAFRILNKAKERVRLAEGLSDNYELTDAAMARGLDCLAKFREIIGNLPASRVRTVATYTLRRASNGDAFLKAAKAVYPYPIEVISGAEEARLIYHGVSHTQPGNDSRLVMDIGGGSTEFIIGRGLETRRLASLGMGCVSFQQRYFEGGKLSDSAFNKAETAAAQELETIEQSYKDEGWQQAIGCSGTIKAVQACIQAKWPGESAITLKKLKALRKICQQAGDVAKLKLPAVNDERIQVFPAGLAILIASFKALGIEALTFSDAALREGLMFQMAPGAGHLDPRDRTTLALAAQYHVDRPQAMRVRSKATRLFSQVKKDRELEALLGWAAELHEVGLQINFHGIQRHSAYILENSDLIGFNQEQQLLLATLVRYSRKGLKQFALPRFNLFNDQDAMLMLRVLRLSILLHRRRQNLRLPELTLSLTDDKTLVLSCPAIWLKRHELVSADLHQEVLYQAQAGWPLVIDAKGA
ncbi:MAG: exopolyphosphatase [Pseudomonadota bacterium]|uniref:exopolyphosphatase n=1 Tax=Gallaecimonas pentaromativorans TaxID=584787 RepID=UPI00067F4916|nr:exopolyphosphatase [Gallaecimonas pentaromativorans]MED5524695.1 exopolyphosphatase [Pseudomonadota bacterium]